MLRWLTIYLFALASAVNPALAALTVNQLSGFNASAIVSGGGGGGDGASVVFNGCTDDEANRSSYDFDGVSVGTADASRIILVGVAAEDGGTAFGLNSSTIGGVSATRMHTSTAGLTVYSNFIIAALASGTTATISLSFSEGITSASICVWSLYDFSSASFASAQIYVWSADSGVMDISAADAEVGDLYAAICASGTSSSVLTFTGVTTTSNAGNGETGIGVGYSFPLSSGGTHTASCDPSGTQDSAAAAVLVRP